MSNSNPENQPARLYIWFLGNLDDSAWLDEFDIQQFFRHRSSEMSIRELVRQTCGAFEIRIVKGVVSKDHVHILANCPPNMAPSEIMSRIKGRTSSKLIEEFPHLKKRYWGRHFWARGYFCATVGPMTEEMIKQYLEHHFEPKANDDFKMESD